MIKYLQVRVEMIKFEDLREWQKKAYMHWVLNECSGIFLGCTGSGKSIAAMYCFQHKNVPTIVIVPTIALMNQWIEEVSRNFNIPIEEIGSIGDGKHSIKKITIAVVNSVRDMDLGYFDMIVLDEAHRYGSDENIKPIMNNKFKYKLGLTATLKRSDGKDSELEDLVGKVVYVYTTENGVKDGVLSEFEIINIGVNLSPKEKIEYDNNSTLIDKSNITMANAVKIMMDWSHPDRFRAMAVVRATTKRKSIISNAEEKMRAILDIIIANNGKKIILFNETIKMAELERKMLNKNGIESEIYHSKMKKQDSIERFRNGEVNILISVKSLNEGLDVKDVDVMIRVAGTSQDRDTIQRLGRGLRIVEGKEGAKYYQIYCKDTLEKWQVVKNTNIIKSASNKVTWI
jgi:superfamily II DNA or RNA helicase